MSHQFLHFSGINSCDVGFNGNSSVSSELLCSHESIALAGCPDLHALLSRKVAKGQMLQELSSSIQDESEQCFPCGTMTKFIQGSTIVPFEDSIYIQLGIGKDGNNTVPCVKSDHVEGEKCHCSWARTIYIVQTKDNLRYGTQFQTIPRLHSSNKLPSMMV
jgi:hypothetical protein